MQLTITRLQVVTALYAEHSASLERLVAKRASTDPDTIQDACAFAWTQLLTHEHVDLTPPHWRSLAWLTQTAIREAWRLHERACRTVGADEITLEILAAARGRYMPAADTIAVQHDRLQLVAQIPERPRRFLLRQALGYSYAEISAHERATLTTTNKQIAGAKRLLRQLEARENAGERGRTSHAGT